MPRWGTYISIDQLGYRRASVRDVVQLASTINRDAGLIILGMYNLALALASMKDGQEQQTERLNVQSALLRNSISEKRLREMKAKFPHSHLVTNPIFHRGQMLTMIKLVAKFGRGTGGNRLERRDDFDVIAELGLLVNSLTPHDLTGSERGDALAPSLAAALEIENPPSVAESMVRANAMLGPYLDRARIHDGFARQLERLFVFSSGLNFEELIDLTFAVWAYYNSLTVTDIIETQSLANFNPMNSKNVVSGKYMVKALDRYAIGFGEVPGLPFGSADASGLLTNHSALKSWPIWKFGDDNYFCVDPAFMQERLSSGVYWTIIKTLDAEDGVNFARLWGRLFERYLWAVLESIYPPERVWRSPKYDDGDEAFDAIIDFGDRLVVIQAKSTFAPADAKYASDSETFFGGMASRFGDEPGAAIRQIRQNLVGCFGLEGRRPMARLRRRRFREILPLVVYQEPILEFGLVTRHFSRELEAALQGVLFTLDLHVRPVTFMHIDDWHLIAQYIRDGDTSLVDILHAKLDVDRGHIESFSAFWRERFRPRLNVGGKGDQVLSASWRQYSDAALDRIRAGVYA